MSNLFGKVPTVDTVGGSHISQAKLCVADSTCSTQSSIAPSEEGAAMDLISLRKGPANTYRYASSRTSSSVGESSSRSKCISNFARLDSETTSGQRRKLEESKQDNDAIAIVPVSPLFQKLRPEAVGKLFNEPVAACISPLHRKILVLALQTDEAVLSPLHVFIRQQIEVFTATKVDMAQPTQGRKRGIKLHQVGFRCIHCKDMQPRDRAKRAVCYPSSVGRVYRSVSDMKFDHFNNCSGLPHDLRSKFQELKEQSKKGWMRKGCVSSTAQYYHDSAVALGMIDAAGGVAMAMRPGSKNFDLHAKKLFTFSSTGGGLLPFDMSTMTNTSIVRSPNETQTNAIPPKQAYKGCSHVAAEAGKTQKRAHRTTRPDNVLALSLHLPTLHTEVNRNILATPTDAQELNPLHCFVRRHIEVFAATNDDINAPSPGRKVSVVLGQVGIRCIHCAKLPPRERVKRSVCYPASVSGIYHSVSNMKFDHFGKCRGLPDDERSLFNARRASCGRHGQRPTTGKPGAISSNSTAQYYHNSAVRSGMIDSASGIRLEDSVEETGANTPKNDSFSLGAFPDGISVLMMAARVRASQET